MVKKLDDATKFLIDTLPDNLQKLATTSYEAGYLSQSEFAIAADADEVPVSEQGEVLDFFRQDLGLDILESDTYQNDMGKYYDADDEGSVNDKSRNAAHTEAEQSEMSEEDEMFARQLEKNPVGTLSMGGQDSFTSYLRQIGKVQLLKAAGEIAIAQRIEAASRLMVYGLCESPMTIQAMLNWYQLLLNEEMRLRDIVDLEAMYSSESEQKSVNALAEALKSKGVETIEELDDDELDELTDTTSEEEEEEEDENKKSVARGVSGVAIPVMEESLTPTILELFAKIKKVFNSAQKLQIKRLENLFTTSTPDDALEKKYLKLHLELFENVSKIKLNEDRISEILDQLTKKDKLLMGLEGKLLRLATASKIKYDDFMVNYIGNELNQNWTKSLLKHKTPAWVNFAKKHEDDIKKIQEDITAIAIETGQPTGEYKKVVELVRRGQSEAAVAKREMIEANLRLVVKFARKNSYRGYGLDLSDLVQDGNIGLMKTVDKFNYRLGNKFSTYATQWIKQSISRNISDQGRMIRIPVHMNDNIRKIQKATRQFTLKHGRQPTAEELSKIIYLPVDKIHKALKVSIKPLSLEAPLGTEDDSSRLEITADETARNPFASAAQKNLRKAISQVLSELDPKEETVLRQRHGMSGNKSCTLEEVGDYIGVTRERIRQIAEKALNKLRHPTRARKLKSFLED